MRRIRASVAVLGLLAATALVGLCGASASADPVTDCSTSKGKIVAVDFHHWSGPIVRGCDPGATAKTSGIALLNAEGFQTTGDQHDGPQFICRIGNSAFHGGTQYPTPSQDPCVVTPPASAYWSYWIATPGHNTWSYSQYGAYSEHSAPGSVELWIFGGTDIQGSAGNPTNGFPVCTPNSLRAGAGPSTCTPTGTKAGHGKEIGVSHRQHGTSGGHRSGGGTQGGTNAHHSSGTGAAGPQAAPSKTAAGSSAAAASSSSAAAAKSASSSAASSRAASASSATSSAAPDVVDAKPASKQVTHAGSALPLILGLSLFVVIGAGAGFTVWRRRQAG